MAHAVYLDDKARAMTVEIDHIGSNRMLAAEFQAAVRIDTPQEALYYANGGILQYVLRQLLAEEAQPEVVTA